MIKRIEKILKEGKAFAFVGGRRKRIWAVREHSKPKNSAPCIPDYKIDFLVKYKGNYVWEPIFKITIEEII